MNPRSGEKPPLSSNSRSQSWRALRSHEGHSRERAFSSLAASGWTIGLTSSPPCGGIKWLLELVKLFGLLELCESVSETGRRSSRAETLPLIDVGRLLRLRYFLPLFVCSCGTLEGDRWLHDRVLQQAPEGAKPVLPADLLAFFVGAAPVADANLIDAQPPLGYLDCYLWFKAEAVLLNGNRLDDVPTEYLVASFHVAQVNVGEAVRQQSEQLVTHKMPEVKNPMRPAAEKT